MLDQKKCSMPLRTRVRNYGFNRTEQCEWDVHAEIDGKALCWVHATSVASGLRQIEDAMNVEAAIYVPESQDTP